MQYVALLRGINVGGNNKVAMSELRQVFEQTGLTNVRTYINSGNVLFETSRQPVKLTKLLEAALEKRFGFTVKVLLRSQANINKIAETLPDTWQNNTETKCDVLFLWDSVDSPDIVRTLPLKPDIDKVIYADGAILWCVERSLVTRSGLLRIVGTDFYKQVTIRNCNTVRKLQQMLINTATN